MNKKKIATQKMKQYLEERMNEEYLGGDFQIPSAEEIIKKLDPHVIRLLETQYERRHRAARLRLGIISIVVILIVGMVTIQPVRAGIWGAITDLYRIIVRDTHPTFSLDMPEAQLITSETGDGYSVSFYQVNEYQVTILVESSGGSAWTWVDRAGDPYVVGDLRIGSVEALCYEDEGGHYALIEMTGSNLIVSLDHGDRALFTTILQSIIVTN